MLPRTYGYLSQDVAHEDPLAGEGTVRDFIFNSTGLDVAINTYEELANEVGQATEGELPALLVRFERAQNELDRLGYYDADARAEQLISGLEVGGVTLERYVSTLSGGQKTKLALVRLLFQAPDLLLLDEPTNFLDVEATAWLMDFLERYSGAILIISHDLDLLDRSINKVLHLNRDLLQLPDANRRCPCVDGTYEEGPGTGDCTAAQDFREAAWLRSDTREPAYSYR